MNESYLGRSDFVFLSKNESPSSSQTQAALSDFWRFAKDQSDGGFEESRTIRPL